MLHFAVFSFGACFGVLIIGLLTANKKQEKSDQKALDKLYRVRYNLNK